MRIAARYADEWNCWGLPELMAHKINVLDRHCREIGRDPASIRRSAQALVLMSDDTAQLNRWRSESSTTPRIIGTTSQVADVIARYGELGLDEFVVSDETLGRETSEKRDGMDRFLDEVAVHLRDRPGS
jgi:alkanesulfonate monooxygenase SsuD/methylene tetrahydromethanopterin reductase-like flavin-dependent oxidoreductase (luciferase family)